MVLKKNSSRVKIEFTEEFLERLEKRRRSKKYIPHHLVKKKILSKK